MWKQHIVGAVIATFIIAAAISFNPFSASGSDEYHWGLKKAKTVNRLKLEHSLISYLRNMVLFIKVNLIKIAYLTFDNGYENGFTESILDTLKKEKAPATFF